MRRVAPLLLIALLVSACGSGHSATNSPSPTHVAQAQPSPTSPTAARTPVPTRPAQAHTPVPTAVVAATSGYTAFLSTVCRALAAGDAGTIRNALPYYQYNSGVRYGFLGDGEGQTGDPSVLSTWLQGGGVRCEYYTPDTADPGHGTALASGWKQPAPWALIEFDTYNGAWKINDFTFGDRASLFQAMQTSQPVLTFHGH